MQTTREEKLAARFVNCFAIFWFLGLSFGIAAAALEEDSSPQVALLILTAVCAVTFCVFGFLTVWVRYKT